MSGTEGAESPAMTPGTSSPLRNLRPSRRMRTQFLREVAEAALPTGPDRIEVITKASLWSLPEAVQRYLKFTGVVGRPRVWSFVARSTGMFRRAPSEPWMPCEAWQYNSRLGITRIFNMRLRMRGFLPVMVRDTYVRGEGRMLGRLFDAVSIVDQADEKIAIGELVTYLNDAILFAPSMLLGPETTFTGVDGHSFDVSLTDGPRRVEARVFVDASGAVTNFTTTDRFGEDPATPGTMIRAHWSTPVDGYRELNGRPIPSAARAVWNFASGNLTYAHFRCEELQLNVT